MKIISLKIQNYKIFNPSSEIELGKDIQLLIGVNGSGKSTILEAIAIIFSNVKSHILNQVIHSKEFNFVIEYSINISDIIEITSTTQSSKLTIHHVKIQYDNEYKIFCDGKEVKSKDEQFKYLPDNLIFYYSGACTTLENIIDLTEDEQAEDLYRKTSLKKVSKAIDNILKNIIYIRKDYYPLLFILNYIDSTCIIPLNHKEFFIDSIRLNIKQYRYTKNNDSSDLFKLTGYLRTYMDGILEYSYNGVERDVDKNIDFIEIGYHNGILDAVRKVTDRVENIFIGDNKFLSFQFISLLFRIGFIKNIEVNINLNDEVISINDLSEGEQQIIILESIKNVLCRENTVLFLDEPDAYLHPQRQRELIPYLQSTFSEGYTQIITTSHSPYVAQSTRYDSILIFDQNGKNTVNDNKVLDTEVITDVLFGINERFKENIEKDLDDFRDFRNNIIKGQNIDIQLFKELVLRLDNYGEETRVIVNRELNQLKRLVNFNFDGISG